jgi:NADH-quinone oxidoreductase subunit D
MADLKEYVLGQRELDDLDRDVELPNELMTVNMGPSHPAMHGTIRMLLTVEGERIVHTDVQPGYLHRCFEKESEHATYNQIFPYTDRLNYVSPMINNVGFALTVEKLLGIEVPERCKYIRVIISELSRITDHMTCVGASAMELGAFTAFLYLLKAREWFYGLLEELSGARLTHSYVRIGGLTHDLTPTFDERVAELLGKTEGVLDECETMLTNNKIFRDRMEGVAVVSKDDAIAWGITGPFARGSGVDYDVRKNNPYLVYDQLEFDVPVGATGDCYDRYLVRLEEIRQSIRILRQAMRQLPDGPVNVDDPRIILPPKKEVYNTIEAMIAHFKLIMGGVEVPAGETYCYVEGGNGELGFFLVSDGTGRPYRLHCKAPCFYILQSFSDQIRGALISDIVPAFGMVNMIGGECDR